MKMPRMSIHLLVIAMVMAIGAANVMADCGGCGSEEKKADDSQCRENKGDRPKCADKAEGEGKCAAGGRLGLSEEDGAKVRAILGEAREAMMAWKKENGEAFKDMRTRWVAAEEADDEEAKAEIAAEKEALMAEAKALHAKYEAQLAEILTEEQMAKLQKMMKGGHGGRGGGRCGHGDKGKDCDDKDKGCDDKGKGRCGHGNRMAMMACKLELTDDQKAQAKEIMCKAMEDAKAAEGREAKMAIFKAAHEQVFNDVLTAEQQERAKAMKEACEARGDKGKDECDDKGTCDHKGDGPKGDPGRRGGAPHGRSDMRQMMAKRLGLTDEQQAEMKTIMADAMEQAKVAEGREAKGAIMKAAHEKIFNEVFTPEQQTKAKAMHEAMGRGSHGARSDCGSEGHDAAQCACVAKGSGDKGAAPTTTPPDALVVEPVGE